MFMKSILTIILCFLLTISVSLGDNKETKIVFNLKEKRGLYFLPIKLNEIDCWFLIDTGASISLLDVNQSQKYEFRYINDSMDGYRINGIGGGIDRYRVYNYKTSYNSNQFKINLSGGDLETITKIMRKDSIHIVGIIGVDFLRMYNAVINYKDKTLTIEYKR